MEYTRKVRLHYTNGNFEFDYTADIVKPLVKYLEQEGISEKQVESLINKHIIYIDDFVSLDEFYDEEFQDFALEYYDDDATSKYNELNDTRIDSLKYLVDRR